MAPISVQKLKPFGIIFLRLQGRPAYAATYQRGHYSSYFPNFTLFFLTHLRHKTLYFHLCFVIINSLLGFTFIMCYLTLNLLCNKLKYKPLDTVMFAGSFNEN